MVADKKEKLQKNIKRRNKRLFTFKEKTFLTYHTINIK